MDYFTAGAYAVTICTYDRRNLFAYDQDGQLALTEIGRLVADSWMKLSRYKPNTFPDHFAVMPDHFHGIVLLNLPYCEGFEPGIVANLSKSIKSFKQFTTRDAQVIHRRRHGANSYLRLWQKSFHDSVIRDEKHLYSVRKYILSNPLSWRIGKYGLQTTGSMVNFCGPEL